MLFRIVNRQMHETMFIRQLQPLSRLVHIHEAGSSFGYFFISDIIGVKANFKRVVAPPMFCSAKAISQGE